MYILCRACAQAHAAPLLQFPGSGRAQKKKIVHLFSYFFCFLAKCTNYGKKQNKTKKMSLFENKKKKKSRIVGQHLEIKISENQLICLNLMFLAIIQYFSI